MNTHSVLVVDDDRLTRESLCELLSDLGHRARGAGRGLSALELLRSEPGDLVVSDVDMPDISGFELLSRLRDCHLGVPVVLMSARADLQLDRAARAAGALGLLPKPVEIRPFRALVQQALV